jgi:hypothetical protein
MTARPNPALGAELAKAEADLEQARERVASSLSALRDEVARQADWRGWLSRHPLISVGGALALGFWLGTRRRPPHLELGGRR